MLHVTSFMQKIAKNNNNNRLKDVQIQQQYQKDLNVNEASKQHSFIFDHYLNKYDYHYNNYDLEDDFANSLGYWGYLRDKNADTNSNTRRSKNKNRMLMSDNNASAASSSWSSSQGFWGQYEDQHLQQQQQMASSSSNEQNEPSTAEQTQQQQQQNYLYDIKYSKFKIQAFKRDETKILMQKLVEAESSYSKQTVKLFNANTIQEQQQLQQINLIHFRNNAASLNKFYASKLTNLKNTFNVLARLNKSINLFTGDSNLSLNNSSNKIDSDENGAAGDYHAEFEKCFNKLNIHACMNGINDLFNNYVATCSSSTTKSNINNKMGTVYLCSNIYECQIENSSNSLDGYDDDDVEEEEGEKNMRPFGAGNHSTMIFECNNVKIGFMALADQAVYKSLMDRIDKHNRANLIDGDVDEDYDYDYDDLERRSVRKRTLLRRIEYADYLAEANKSSEHLRNCGANIIVALALMNTKSDLDRLTGQSSDLDLVISCNDTGSSDSVNEDEQLPLTYKQIVCNEQLQKQSSRWLIKSSSSSASKFIDHLSLISLKLSSQNSNRIVDIGITKYNLD